MAVRADLADDDLVAGAVTGPLSSIDVLTGRLSAATRPGTASCLRPLALRELWPAPNPETVEHRYDPVRQVAVDAQERPVLPALEKEWSKIEGTHTDGDGGDNEMWTWEEQ